MASSPEPLQDVFERLPKEVLLDIVKLSSDFSCLWSIIISSRTVAVLFTKLALEIINAVAAAIVPDQTRALMWALLRARVSNYRALDEARNVTSTTITPLSSIDTKDSNSLRYLVFMGHKIHVLAHMCIDYYIRESLTMRPSTIIEPPTHGWNIQNWFKTSKGQAYQPRDTGPLSWIEEQRAIKSLWLIELFSELNTAQTTGLLNWSKDELEILSNASLARFYIVRDFELQQILTVCEFLQISKEKISL